MRGYILRGCISVLALWAVATALPNFTIAGIGAWLGSALAIGAANGLVRTVVVFYVLPLTVTVVGPLLLALNAVLLASLAVIFEGIEFGGAVAGLVGWAAIAGTATLATWFIGPEGGLRTLVATRSRNS